MRRAAVLLLLLLPASAAAELLPFDQPARARWSATWGEVRGGAVLDSSASRWGEWGVRAIANAELSGVLALLDLDVDLDARALPTQRTLSVGEGVRARYAELAVGGEPRFSAVAHAGEVHVEEMLRTSEVAALALTFSLEFTAEDGDRRLLADGWLVTDPAPADFLVDGRTVVWDEPVVVDEQLEVGVGCSGEPVEPEDDGGGCGGDPVEPDPATSDSSGCEGDVEPSSGSDSGGCEGDVGGGSGGGGSAGGGCEGGGSSGGGSGGGCEGGGGGGGGGGGCSGDPMMRAARAHGPLGLVFTFLAARRLRPRTRNRRRTS